MNKVYNRIEWENYPSTETPVNEQNLNKIDVGLNEVDNRVITLDTTKFNKTEAQGLIKNITFDLQTGILKKYYYNGSTEEINTGISKLNMNLRFDKESQILYIVNADGTEDPVDLSVFITNYEFEDSNTIAHNVSADGTVTSIVKDGSITEDKLQPNYLAEIKVESAKAEAAATDADASKVAAAGSASTAATKASEAATSATNAASSANTAEVSATAAAESAATATNKASEAAASETNAANSKMAAATSATNAANSASTATTKANAASSSATAAANSATSADTYAKKAQSYAVGTGGVRPNEATDNAKYYYEQSRDISQGLAGALIPMGTVTFANLPALANAESGWMYNVSDQFTTTADFKEGAGNVIPAGANVYKTADGKWDVLAGTPVTGIKGSAETSYRRGNVNITPANIGAVNKAGDTMSGTLSSSKATNTYLDGNQGQAIINSTARAGAYTMLDKLNSTNGYFTDGVHLNKRVLQYTEKPTVDAGTNAVTKSVTLLDESGNTQFPGTVTATKFSGNATTATKATQDENGNNIVDTYLTKTGDSANNTVAFTSGDSTNPTAWADVSTLVTGEKHSSILNKISTMFRNVRYLWKLIGNTQLSVGDGTITGAINEINKKLIPISLPIETYKSEYISEGPNVIVEYVAGIATILVYFALAKSVPAWTSIEIAQVRKANFGTTYSNVSTPGDNTSAFLINIDVGGKITAASHGAVSKLGWYNTSFPARCFYSG